MSTQSETWLCLQSGLGAADYNMALDEALMVLSPEIGAPVLRFYGWKDPAASFGYSQKYHEVAAATLLRPLARRPTGGGIVPHDADWTYSLAFPPNHFWYGLKAMQSYERAHQWIRNAFGAIGVQTALAPTARKEIPGQCFIGAEQFDVLWHGRKIAGAAQRRARSGLLIQGSVQPPPLSLARADWEAAMRRVAETEWNVHWKDFELTEPLERETERLRLEKYSQPSFNERR